MPGSNKQRMSPEIKIQCNKGLKEIGVAVVWFGFIFLLSLSLKRLSIKHDTQILETCDCLMQKQEVQNFPQGIAHN